MMRPPPTQQRPRLVQNDILIFCSAYYKITLFLKYKSIKVTCLHIGCCCCCCLLSRDGPPSCSLVLLLLLGDRVCKRWHTTAMPPYCQHLGTQFGVVIINSSKINMRLTLPRRQQHHHDPGGAVCSQQQHGRSSRTACSLLYRHIVHYSPCS